MSPSRSHICVTTFGAQPQIVTLALDSLYARGYPIREVFAIHLATRDERMRQAIRRLDAEFLDGSYQGWRCRYQRRPVQLGTQLIEDLDGNEETAAASKMLYQLICELKQEEATVHLCISGGRRLLGMLALSAALLYFDQTDKIWHLYSSDAVRASSAAGAQMHLPDHPEVRLIEVDLPTWGQFFPALRAPRADSPISARAIINRQSIAATRSMLHALLGELTSRQRDVLRLLVSGLTVPEVAKHLKVAQSTVNSHREAILSASRAVWTETPDQPISLVWLRRALAPFQDEL